jgi:hypothetical protein
VRVNVVPGAFRHIRVWFTTSNVDSVEPVCRVKKDERVMVLMSGKSLS